MKWMVVFAFALCTIPALAKAEIIERIAAVVGDDIITLHDLREEGTLRYLVRGRDIRDIDDAFNSADLLDDLTREIVQTRLIARQAKKLEIYIGDREVDMQLQEMYQRSGQTEADFKEMMASEGIDWQAYRRYLRSEIETQFVMRSELAGQVTPPEADVMACAMEKSPEGLRDVTITLRQIILPEISANTAAGLAAPATAPLNPAWWNSLDQAMTQLAKGVHELAANRPNDFVSLVHTFSTGRSIERDGLLGAFSPGDLSKDFNAVFALSDGEVAPLITTSAGYHILMADSVVVGESEAWKKLINQCREQITMQESQRLIESWLNDLMEKNFVSITVNRDIRL